MELELKYTYETMPKSKASTSGMKMIEGDINSIRAEMQTEDVVYKRENGHNLKIRLVYPDFFEQDRKYPVVCHVQGSAWFEQNLSSHVLDFKDIVTSGYVLAVIEYSCLPAYIFPSQVLDIKSAIRYINEHADELKVDRDNIFLSGDSSGGHTALLCWATWNSEYLDTSKGVLPELKGCIDFYGVVDFVTITEAESGLDHHSMDSPEALLMGKKLPTENRESAVKASISYYLDKQTNIELSPLIILHGNKDKVVPFEQSVQLYEKCKTLNIQADFYCVNNADHGGNVFFCDAVINKVIGFLNKHTS